jgi:hypothetical protein
MLWELIESGPGIFDSRFEIILMMEDVSQCFGSFLSIGHQFFDLIINSICDLIFDQQFIAMKHRLESGDIFWEFAVEDLSLFLLELALAVVGIRHMFKSFEEFILNFEHWVGGKVPGLRFDFA